VTVRWPWVIAGLLSLGVTAPVLGEVYASLGSAVSASTPWVLVAVACVAVGFASTWTLQRIVLRADRWSDVIAPQLASNAASNILPAGSALGSVIQLRMLRRNGFDFTRSMTALAITGMLGTLAALLVFPVLVLFPVGDSAGIDTGSSIGIGLVVLVLCSIAVVIALRSERPMQMVANGVHRALRQLPGCHPPADLATRIMGERDLIREALRRRKSMVVATSLGRVLGDYLALYASLFAVGLHPSPMLVLAAFIAANAAGMLPFTPGGLGFVEAGLAGAIVLWGADEQQALGAVAIYRLVSCWIPVLAGVGAYLWTLMRPRTQPTPDETAAACADPSPDRARGQRHAPSLVSG
jgi:uncharacterized protein (TIRG00374 family)